MDTYQTLGIVVKLADEDFLKKINRKLAGQRETDFVQFGGAKCFWVYGLREADIENLKREIDELDYPKPQAIIQYGSWTVPAGLNERDTWRHNYEKMADLLF